MIPVWFIRAPANVTVLLWQVSQGALVTTWFDGFPSAATPLWQAAQRPVRPAWLNLAPILDEPGVTGATGIARADGAAGPEAATFGDALRAAAVLGDAAIGDVAAGAFAVAALGFAVAAVAAVGVVAVAGLAEAAGATAVAAPGAAVVVVGAAVEAVAVADCVAAARAAAVGVAVVVAVAAPAGAATGAAAAVVEHPAGDFRRGSKLVVLVWQQPQSAVVEGWSLDFPSGPLLPWLVNEPL